MKKFKLVPADEYYLVKKISPLDRLLSAGKPVVYAVMTSFFLGMVFYTCLIFIIIQAFVTQSNINFSHYNISSKAHLEELVVEEPVSNYSIHVNYADSIYGATSFFASIVFDDKTDTDNIEITLNIKNCYYEIEKIGDGVFYLKCEYYNPAHSDVQITAIDGDGTVIFRQ